MFGGGILIQFFSELIMMKKSNGMGKQIKKRT
jgi:hypothetical protein